MPPRKKNSNTRRPHVENSNLNDDDEAIHFKKYRKDQRLEKQLRSSFGGDLDQSDYAQYQTKKTKIKFSSYENKEDSSTYNNNQHNKTKKQWGKHQQQQHIQNSLDSDSSKDFKNSLNQYNDRSSFGQDGKRGNRNSQGGNRKSFKQFKDHWTAVDIQLGLESQNIFSGVIQLHEERREFATIKSSCFEQRIFLDNVESQNRAFNGAEVAFKIIKVLDNDRNSLSTKKNDQIYQEKEKPLYVQVLATKIKKTPNQMEGNDEDSDWSNDESEQIDKGVPQIQARNSKESLFEKYKDKKLIGQVVGLIKDTTRTRDIVGKIDIVRKNPQQDKLYQGQNFMDTIQKNYHISFKSLNKKNPWFKVGQVGATLMNDFTQGQGTENLEKILEPIRNNYFKGRFSKWDRDSYYPTIQITDKIGFTGDIEIECQALLTEHQVHTDDFSQECLDSMMEYKLKCDDNGEYIITPEERLKRLDLSNEIICTVDPVTARDLDDALSVKEIEKDIFEIGVHIADVSHFVEMDSLVDLEAQLRTTSVYLVHRVIPMLPRILCENLCSLNPGVERLAFSVFFYIKRDGEVLWDRPIRIHKTIIKSCVKLSYDVVNEIIEGKIIDLEQLPSEYKIIPGVDRKQLFNDIVLLNELGQKRRHHRLENGSLILESNKLRFRLDAQNVPITYQSEQRRQAQFMVEEWMLLANQFVGMELVKFDKRTAVLRNHEPPQKAKTNYFKRQLQICNLLNLVDDFDISDSVKLQHTLNIINENKDLNQEVKDILSFKLIKLLEAAKYFVVGDTESPQWHHYALNFDVYTHFTSPIRRYPDVLVHRLLFETMQQKASDDQQQIISRNSEMELIKLMNRCNECKLSARRVSEGCEKIFMCIYLKQNPVFTDGYITEVSSVMICIIVPTFNLEIKKKVSDLQNLIKCQFLKNSNQNNDTSQLIIEYQDNSDLKGKRVHLVQALTKIKIHVSSTNKFPIDYLVKIVVDQKSLNSQGEVITVPHLF